jgi:heat shock protein HslJ
MRNGRAPRAVAGVVCLGFLALVSCGSSSKAGSATTKPSAPASSSGLEGTTWELAAGALVIPGAEHVVPTLLMQDETASGWAGCNNYSTHYVLSGSSLTFGTVASTKKACGAVPTAVENQFLQRLSNVSTYSIASGRLQLLDSTGQVVLRFAAANTSIVGSWAIIGYLTSTGSAFTSAVVGSKPTAVFDANGTVSGTTGCNTYHGPWKESAGGSIKIGPLATTLIGCPEDLAVQDASIGHALEAATKAVVATHDATLLDSAGRTAMEMTR